MKPSSPVWVLHISPVNEIGPICQPLQAMPIMAVHLSAAEWVRLCKVEDLARAPMWKQVLASLIENPEVTKVRTEVYPDGTAKVSWTWHAPLFPCRFGTC